MKKETLMFDSHGRLHGVIWVPITVLLALVLGLSVTIPMFWAMCIYFTVAMVISLVRWGDLVDKALSSSKMRVDQ